MATSARAGAATSGPKTAEGRRYAGRSAEERRQDRRERLLDAALELFSRQGYANTTIEGLCREARLNPRYFYEQFDDREQLLEALYDRINVEVAGAVLPAVLAAPPEIRARCEAGARAFAEAMLADERYARIGYVEVVGVSPAFERRRRRVIRANAELLEQVARTAVEAGEIPDRDYRMTTIGLMGAADELLVDWLSAKRRPPVEALVEELAELYAAALSRPTRDER